MSLPKARAILLASLWQCAVRVARVLTPRSVCLPLPQKQTAEFPQINQESAAHRRFRLRCSGICLTQHCHCHTIIAAVPVAGRATLTPTAYSVPSLCRARQTYVGTISYMAPEVTELREGAANYDGAKADSWHAGPAPPSPRAGPAPLQSPLLPRCRGAAVPGEWIMMRGDEY